MPEEGGRGGQRKTEEHNMKDVNNAENWRHCSFNNNYYKIALNYNIIIYFIIYVPAIFLFYNNDQNHSFDYLIFILSKYSLMRDRYCYFIYIMKFTINIFI